MLEICQVWSCDIPIKDFEVFRFLSHVGIIGLVSDKFDTVLFLFLFAHPEIVMQIQIKPFNSARATEYKSSTEGTAFFLHFCDMDPATPFKN